MKPECSKILTIVFRDVKEENDHRRSCREYPMLKILMSKSAKFDRYCSNNTFFSAVNQSLVDCISLIANPEVSRRQT